MAEITETGSSRNGLTAAGEGDALCQRRRGVLPYFYKFRRR